jgi:tRNA modification GTPase
MLEIDDTIAAIATARGVGALGIVRVSGFQVHDILDKCFKNSSGESVKVDSNHSHHAYFGTWVDPLNNEPLDQVVTLYFAETRGFTGQPAADIICHGGPHILEQVLSSLIKAGARLANPGEFSYRAVMNNRLDLVQAENTLQLIQANSPIAAKRALKQMRGALSLRVSKLESDVIYLLAHLEASIDFSTEDIQPVDFSKMQNLIAKMIHETDALIAGFRESTTINKGIRIALVGRPNAGKSSILNAVVGRRRSIVSSEPGTTRDTIEAEIVLDSFLVRLIDTAGIRNANDDSERQGVDLSYEEALTADHSFYVVDASVGMTDEDIEILSKLDRAKVTLCFNKSDLKEKAHPSNFKDVELFEKIETSAVINDGCKPLIDILSKSIIPSVSSGGDFDVSTIRQRDLLQNVSQKLRASQQAISRELSPELITLELQEIQKSLAEVLGRDVGDEVMDRVFKEFCIGK